MNLMKKVLVIAFVLVLAAGQSVYAGKLIVKANGFSENELGEKTIISAHIQTKHAAPEYSGILCYANADLKIHNRTTGTLYELHSNGMMRATSSKSPKVSATAYFFGTADPDGIPDNADDLQVTIWLSQNSSLMSGQDVYKVTLQKRSEGPWTPETIYDSTETALQGGNITVRYMEDKNTDNKK